MARNSHSTKTKILAALGKLLAEKGFDGVGVNAVARAAGVDKVLIYRYFGGLPELLRAYARQGEHWPTTSQLLGGQPKRFADENGAALSTRLLSGHLRELGKRPLTQEVMRWELIARNELTDELAAAREQQGLELMSLPSLAAVGQTGFDLPAVAALLHAGITYLTLRAKTADVYLGIPLHSRAGKKRLEKAIADLIRLYFTEVENTQKTKRGKP